MKVFILILSVLVAPALGLADQPPVEAMEDDFSPMLFGFVVIGLCVLLFLFAISIVAALFVALSIGFLVAAGVLSSSVFIGILRGQFLSGFRALHYQICAIATLPAGIGLLWLGSSLAEMHLRPRDIVMIGSISGICGGLLLAFALDWLARFARRRLNAPTLADTQASGRVV